MQLHSADATLDATGLGQTIVCHNSLVQLRASIEGDDASLCVFLSVQRLLAIHQLDSEAKRTLVENLVFGVALRINYIGPAPRLETGSRYTLFRRCDVP